MSDPRRTENIHPNFFNDGYWYVLTSRTLGGSGLDAGAIADALQSQAPAHIRTLMDQGACLPLQFPGDCALDGETRFVFGPLEDVEEAEWVGRVRSVLEVPDGELVLMGGGLDEDFEAMMTGEQDPHDVRFQVLEVKGGRYLVDVYAFVGSMTVNFAWEEEDEERSTRSLREYWHGTRPGEEEPAWLRGWAEEGYADGEGLRLLSYVVRIQALDGSPPTPAQDDETGWVSGFEIRRPAVCPRGISFES